MKAIIEPSLRVTPSPKAQIELPTINLSEYYTNHSICLNALEERIGVKIPGEQLWLIKGMNSSKLLIIFYTTRIFRKLEERRYKTSSQ